MSEERATDARDRVLDSLADDILALAGGRRLIAIDGVDGSGKTTFARELAAVLSGESVVVIHVDDFLNLREVRHHRGRDSAVGFWLDSYDYDALWRDVLEPLGTGGSGAYRTAASDHRRDTAVRPALQYAPENSVVLVEGMFLHRDELVEGGITRYSSMFRSRKQPVAWRCETGVILTPSTHRCDATSAGNVSISRVLNRGCERLE